MEPEQRKERLREGLLALGFLLLVVAAAWTVAVPELTKEPESGPKAEKAASASPPN